MSKNLEIKKILIIIFFSIYIFFWDINFYQNYSLRYSIILIYILYIFSSLKNLNYKKNDIIKNFDLKLYYIFAFIFFHYLLANIINSTDFYLRDFIGIIFLFIIFFTYVKYREIFLDNFQRILYIFFTFLLLFSIFKNQNIHYGSCNIFFTDHIQRSFALDKDILIPVTFSSGLFKENSHLGMMVVGSIIASFFYIINENKKDLILIFLATTSLIITLFNLSTTFLVSYVLSSLIIILFFFQKITKKFSIFLIISSILFSIIFFTNYECKKKLSDIEIKNVISTCPWQICMKNLSLQGTLTSAVYERSMIVSLKTIAKKPWGWGFDGNSKGTIRYLNSIGVDVFAKAKDNPIHSGIYQLNLKDGLGNLFKLVVEFGIFSFFIFYFFLKYLLLKKKIEVFDIFVISIFITQCLRGAGYFNGGFALVLAEILYFNFNYRKKSDKI